MDQEEMITAKGGCLCGAVEYEIRGSLPQGIVLCHCSKCRRTHGHVAAFASIKSTQLTLTEERGLKWYRSVKDETPDVYRGFCSECGSSLFWNPRSEKRIAVAAGSLDLPTGLETIGHVWLSQASDYYAIHDNLIKYARGWGSEEYQANKGTNSGP